MMPEPSGNQEGVRSSARLKVSRTGEADETGGSAGGGSGSAGELCSQAMDATRTSAAAQLERSWWDIVMLAGRRRRQGALHRLEGMSVSLGRPLGLVGSRAFRVWSRELGAGALH